MAGAVVQQRRHIALAIVLLIVGSACGRSAPVSGVNLKPLTTELAFGVPESTNRPAPPNSNAGPNLDDLFKIPDFGSFPTLPPIQTPPPPIFSECREADPASDFPKVAASTVVSAVPRAGTYRWLIEGTQETGPAGTIQFPKQITKTVHDVEVLADDEDQIYQFSVTEKEVLFASSATVTQTYLVRQTASPADEDGVFLTKIETKVGNDVTTFAPEPQIMILQIPVTLGETVVAGPVNRRPIDEAGVDPTTQEVLRLQGTVLNRYSVDACGDVVQGWFVEGTREFISSNDANGDGEADAYTANYNYMVATQYGGLVIYEWTESPCANEVETTPEERQDDERRVDKCSTAPTLVMQSNLGQLDPSPLPEGAGS